MTAEVRVGQCSLMHCGLMATVINYINQRDIDVKFENGEIRRHCNYQCFQAKKLLPPSMQSMSLTEARIKRLHEMRVMNCGLKATIIDYRNNNDIDVEFSNGYIRQSCNYKNFCKGEILPVKNI